MVWHGMALFGVRTLWVCAREIESKGSKIVRNYRKRGFVFFCSLLSESDWLAKLMQSDRDEPEHFTSDRNAKKTAGLKHPRTYKNSAINMELYEVTANMNVLLMPKSLMNECKKTARRKCDTIFQRNHFDASFCMRVDEFHWLYAVHKECKRSHTMWARKREKERGRHLHQSKYTYHILYATDIRLIYFKLICGECTKQWRDQNRMVVLWIAFHCTANLHKSPSFFLFFLFFVCVSHFVWLTVLQMFDHFVYKISNKSLACCSSNIVV